jgi:hypothetical protein
MVLLKFLGKKDDFIFENENLQTKVLDFSGKDRTARCHVSDAEWLMKFSPQDFKILSDAPVVTVMAEPEPEIETEMIDVPDDEEVPEMLSCPKCGKEYSPSSKTYFERHLEKCGADV